MSAAGARDEFIDRFGTTAATIAIVAGGAGSVALLLRASQRKGAPLLLVVLFAGWVASPYALVAAARMFAKRWPPRGRLWIDFAAITVAVASLAVYAAAALGPSDPKTAIFVLVAPASWLLIGIAVTIAALTSDRR